MGSISARRAVTALATACIVVACPVPASAAPPTNDSLLAPHDIVISSTGLAGTRVFAVDGTVGLPIFGVDTTEATTTAEEPFLASPNETSDCNDFAVQGSDTVFYRLRQQLADATLVPLPERTSITLDTTDSSYATAIVVYREAIAQPNAIRCERSNLAAGAAMTTFVTEPDVEYFVEVASVGGAGAMNLFVRATDIQPPTVVLSASPALGSPGRTTTFTVNATDDGSDVSTRAIEWTATYLPDNAPPGAAPTPLKVERSAEGDQITVRWPAGTVPGTGQVIARAWDQAGNVGRSSLSIKVRDRQPPRVVSGTYRRQAARGRVAATIRCNEPGTATITLRVGGRGARPARGLKVQKGVARTVVFRSVPRPSVFQLEYVCFDREPARNQSATLYRVDTFGF
jgi:hypothetical protein